MHVPLLILAGSLPALGKPSESVVDVDTTLSNEVGRADEDLRLLYDEWQARQQRVVRDPALEEWFTRYRQLQSEASSKAVERDMKRAAYDETRQLAASERYAVERCALRDQDSSEEISAGESDLGRRVRDGLSALEEAGGLDARSARGALDQWWQRWTDLDWEAALARAGGLDDVHRAAAELRRAAQPVRALAPTVDAILAAADQLESQYVQRRDDRVRCAELDPGVHEAEADRLDGELRTLSVQLADLTGALAALEAKRPPVALSDSDPFLVRARTLSGAYAEARGRLDSEPGHVDHDLWCRVYINGSVAMLFAGDYGTATDLRTAAGSFKDGCVHAAEAWSELPLFQQEWIKALSDPSRATTATLWILFPSRGGRWFIDGLEVSGNGWAPYSLKPGSHRLEFQASTAWLPAEYLELEGEYAYMARVGDDERQIAFDLADDRVRDEEEEVTAIRPGGGGRTGEVPPKLEPTYDQLTSRWNMSASSAWMRELGTDHVGGSLSAAFKLLDREHIRLELALHHDMGQGTGLWFYTGAPDTGDAGTPLLIRERFGVALARPIDDKIHAYTLRPRAELTLGTIPFNAVTLGLGGGVDVRLSRRVFARISVEGGRSVWGDGLTPALDGPDGGTVWDLSANAGVGYHLQ